MDEPIDIPVDGHVRRNELCRPTRLSDLADRRSRTLDAHMGDDDGCPSLANRVAMALPMPLAPPVTIATPSSRRIGRSTYQVRPPMFGTNRVRRTSLPVGGLENRGIATPFGSMSTTWDPRIVNV